jgi:hypothetical protein
MDKIMVLPRLSLSFYHRNQKILHLLLEISKQINFKKSVHFQGTLGLLLANGKEM